MTAYNNTSNLELKEFVDNICSNSHLRVEKDLGDGYFKLRPSEAQRRQAAQDIRCSEDAIVEMLRNSKDANAKNIFISTNKEKSIRHINIIDDGCGIPESHHKSIFEPYVTSKLDTMTYDRWGVHGRGMALYSIKCNSEESRVIRSFVNTGTCIYVQTNINKLSEKVDQSTFPSFYVDDSNSLVARGPKNILRTICEFAIENREKVNIFYGSPSEIAATLYYITTSIRPSEYVFNHPNHSTNPLDLLKYASDAKDFVNFASQLGLILSTRTAIRIINQEIMPLDSILEIIAKKGIKKLSNNKNEKRFRYSVLDTKNETGLDISQIKHINFSNPKKTKIKISQKDIESINYVVKDKFKEIASKYYLNKDISPSISIRGNKMTISFLLQQE